MCSLTQYVNRKYVYTLCTTVITNYNVYSNSYYYIFIHEEEKTAYKTVVFFYLYSLLLIIVPCLKFFSNQTILGMCVSLIREVTVLLQQPY